MVNPLTVLTLKFVCISSISVVILLILAPIDDNISLSTDRDSRVYTNLSVGTVPVADTCTPGDFIDFTIFTTCFPSGD
jgi:hypothetical protein